MMVDLKPCPFCGCAPCVDGDKIVCPERHCWGPIVDHYDSIDDAAEAWNRRAISPAWADRPMEVSAMRELPRDLVTILRTEAKNQRTPPIDYVIAEDGGRMVHRPDPDIAMAELLEEAASALAEKDAELAAMKVKCQALDDECQQSMLDIARERDRAERAEAQLAAGDIQPVEWRDETDAEHIARDIKEGRFPRRSERQKRPAVDDAWERIRSDGELDGARRKLSMHELRRIIKHAVAAHTELSAVSPPDELRTIR